ncbi:hypothetical protein [Pseudomonas sp. nanlin1]|uniref:hypothetical protein n=1 Tax=Pseudomonas sp. nanlin1 TaxID=3040605 RepID=UPI00388FC554
MIGNVYEVARFYCSSSVVSANGNCYLNESAEEMLVKDIHEQPALSSLASRLSASALRADARESGLGHAELTNVMKALRSQIWGADYYSNREKHDAYVPDTDDLEWLARAKQASDYVKAAHNGFKDSVANPFANLSNEQLALITYDDSGAFTLNERQAAAFETAGRESAWRTGLLARGNEEYSRTGGMKDFYQEIIDNYWTLSPIERTQYPADYVSDLQNKMNQPNDPLPVNANPQEMKTLFDILFPPRENLSENGLVGIGKAAEKS